MPPPPRGQAGEALSLGPLVKLVLAEDGTAVESEGFFGALAPHTLLMALAPGQCWEPAKVRHPQLHPQHPNTPRYPPVASPGPPTPQ